MSKADTVVQRALDTHGVNCVYTSITQGVYDIETGGVTNTATPYTIKTYKKHIKATQYHYPSLIGKDAAVFYLKAVGLAFVPKPQDSITLGSGTFKVVSFEEHHAFGALVLYKVIGVLG